jgi:hypothetical protein
MGFNKLYLPEIDKLKTQLLDLGNEQFVEYWVGRYAKTDAIIGSVDSEEFIKQFIEKEYETNGHQSITKTDTKTNNY